MPEFFTVSLLFLRLDDGTKKQLPYTYATAFQPTGNFSIVGNKDFPERGAINIEGKEIIAVRYIGLEELLRGYDKIIDVIDNQLVIGEKKGKYGAADIKKMEIIC